MIYIRGNPIIDTRSDRVKIYTKTGDEGRTSLFDGVRVDKDNIRVESYGTVDELGAILGLSKHYLDDEKVYNIIENIQNKLFTLSANLATEDPSKIKYKMKDKDIEELELIIDEYMDKFTGFIVAGTSKASAHLHQARTVARRAERRIISLSKIARVDPLVIKYINRLSDALYALARSQEKEKKSVKYEN